MKDDSLSINVLVVDDEEANCKLVAKLLKNLNFVIFTAVDANSAIEIIGKEKIHIVVTDKNMPGLDDSDEGGMDLLRYIRQHFPEIQVMVMTGYATVETAIEAMRLGAFDYIIKPFSVKELAEKIGRVVDYLKFINPEKMIDNYKAIQGVALSLITDNNFNVDVEKQHELIDSFNQKLDMLFTQVMKQEAIVVEQRDTLAEISALAEQAMEKADEGSEINILLEKIYNSSNRRV